MKTIFVSGPESSGKTSLVQWAAAEFGCPYKLEYARHFFDWHPEKLPGSAELIRQVYAGQMRIWKNACPGAQGSADKALLLDTCPLNFYLWHSWQYGDTWVEPLLELQKWPGEILVLLCKPDIPWVADGQRNNEADQKALFHRFEMGWRSLPVKSIVVQGTGEERFLRCRDSISSFLSRR